MSVWINDINNSIPIGEIVTISGVVVDRRKKNRDEWYITIKDYSGEIGLVINVSETMPANLFWNQTILQISGVVSQNERGKKYLNQIHNVFVMSKAKNNAIQLPEMDSALNQKVVNMVMSNMCRFISSYFQLNEFIEFESSIISRTWQPDGLEPVSVLYPGFGYPVKLTTSPSPQIVDFLKTAMVTRAFTSTKSFATTYRFKEGSTELRVIMAKALNLSKKDLVEVLIDLTNQIILEFGKDSSFVCVEKSNIISCDWNQRNTQNFTLPINIASYATNFDVCYDSYSSNIEQIIHVLDIERNILAEGSYEQLPNGLYISTITIYPSQYLSLLDKTPSRQLRELWRKHGW